MEEIEPASPNAPAPVLDDTGSPVDRSQPKHRAFLDRPVVPLLCVFVGGLLGTAAREALSLTFPSTGISYITWIINAGGALLLGTLTGAVPAGGSSLNRLLRLAVGTGLCGGFTTYSALAEQTADLAGHASFGAATLYGLGTVVTGALAAWAGLTVGRAAATRFRVAAAEQTGHEKTSVPQPPIEGAAPASGRAHPAALEAGADR